MQTRESKPLFHSLQLPSIAVLILYHTKAGLIHAPNHHPAHIPVTSCTSMLEAIAMSFRHTWPLLYGTDNEYQRTHQRTHQRAEDSLPSPHQPLEDSGAKGQMNHSLPDIVHASKPQDVPWLFFNFVSKTSPLTARRLVPMNISNSIRHQNFIKISWELEALL